ncbi:MAG: ABC transporter substrate-binding protein [Betaproteobacteria bacterium]|nr:ABC transporter substrate-binding protein [Betaproteobacteria bacterium]
MAGRSGRGRPAIMKGSTRRMRGTAGYGRQRVVTSRGGGRMNRNIGRFLVLLALVFWMDAGAWAAKRYGPGVTDTEIAIGQTMPYSGVLSAYGQIGSAQRAYFAMLNAKGGINGRKIRLISLDDSGLPPKTVEQVRKLVEQDHVLLIFNSFGPALDWPDQPAYDVQASLSLGPGDGERRQQRVMSGEIAGLEEQSMRMDPEDLRVEAQAYDRVDLVAHEEALASSGGVSRSEDARRLAADEGDMDLAFAGQDAVESIAQPARLQDTLITSRGAVVPSAQQALGLPFKPSIAVLPFNNLSGDPEQDFVDDGLAEDLITALSRIHWLFVSARNSSFSFKGAPVSVGEVARVLGVRYVVEGSVRKAGNRIRVTAQLIDAETGNHVWATRYDREIADIFAIQDEISEAFVAAIEPEIGQVERERARRKPPDSLDCWEHYQRGLWHLYKFTASDNAEAKRLLQHAIRLDPGFGPAHAGLGYAYFLDTIMGFGVSDRSIQDSYRSIRQAIALDDRNGHAHHTLGRLYMLLGDPEQAYAQSQRAVELNPSLAVAHFGLGHALMLIGQAEEGLAEFDAAIRLSPRDPILWAFECTKSHALILLRQYDEAVNWARRSVRHPTAGVWAYIALVCALGHAGDKEHAKVALSELLEIKPDCTLTFVKNYLPFVRELDFEHYAAGLIKAGFGQSEK